MALQSESVQHPALREVILGITRHTGIVNVYIDCQDARGSLLMWKCCCRQGISHVCAAANERLLAAFGVGGRTSHGLNSRQELDHAPHHIDQIFSLS